MAARLQRLLWIPGLRRYAAEFLTLQTQVAEARAQVAQFEREQAEREQRDRSLGDDGEILAKAKRFDYDWDNAAKKIDVRGIEAFGVLATRAHRDGRTYLHLDRLYTLWQAAMAMPPAARAAVEVGVCQGGSAKFIADALRGRGLDLPLYACDTFDGHVEVDEARDARHKVGKQFRIRFDKVVDYLKDTAAVRILKGDIRATAGDIPAELPLGLVHIDVDVYPITRFCLERFAPQVVPGGTIVVDDYGFKTCPGAKQAVDEFVAGRPQFRMLHMLTGQAVLIRLAE